MWIVRFRTHGPWQQESYAEGDESEDEHGSSWLKAMNRAEELSKQYGEVRMERFELYSSYKNGKSVLS